MDLSQIEGLLAILAEKDVGEFRYEDEAVNIRVRFGQEPVIAAAAVAPAPVAMAAAAPSAAPAHAAAKPVDDANIHVVESPMVGTFYAAPAPDADNFVEVGATVTARTTVCIVEAMKLMNEIEAEVAGTIVEVLVENAQAVQFGQPLFKIRKS